MDPITLSRWQFASTTIYHFFFVPLTLGLVFIVAVLETIYVRTGDESYKRMAKFWGKLFLINFAAGVVTGIVLEFQIGMNWSGFSRYVGDIFGAPLAVEGLLAFFLESTFLGIWIFGWDRLSKGLHLAAIWVVAFGSSMSALWILIANGWMQHPIGFVINEQMGRAELVDFAALVFNPRAWLLFWHTLSSGLVTASFFVIGISAYHLARERRAVVFQRSFRLGALLGTLSAVMVVVSGHTQGIYLREVQPMAAAASEALWETADPAPFSVVATFDSSGKRETWSWRIPNALSWLYYFRPEGMVEGINQIQAEYVETYGPGDYVPVVAIDFWAFRVMVGLGFLLVAVGLVGSWIAWKGWPEKTLRWVRWMVWVIPLPYLANTTGWLLTETARQPWVVHGLLLTRDAVSPTATTASVLVSLIGFVLVYGLLMVATIFLLAREARAGAEDRHPGAAASEPFSIS